MALTPGTALTAGLVLEREIGKGGMGAVWIAKNAALGSRVAVKVLHREGGGSSDEARRRFEQEARGLARLDHPNLVRIFDFGMTEEGDPFIVMELLRGEDLAQRLVRGPLDLGLASSVLRQTCRALSRAHDAGVIHRDIKPANIFLCESDDDVVVKVLDFGVARFEQGALDSMTRTGALVGTPYFMSPEQHMNPKGIDHRSDLWSVAVVAFMCLTGTMPFTGETITQLGFAVLEGQRQKLRSIRPELPAALDIWMDRALTKDPAQRYQSAKELAEAFDRARSASPAHVPSAHAIAGSARPNGPPSVQPASGPAASAHPGGQAAYSTQGGPGYGLASHPAASQGVPTAPSAGAGPASAMVTQPAAVPVVAAAAPPAKKGSMAPLLIIGGVVVAGLAGGGVWLAMRGDSSTTAASASAKPKTAAATTTSTTGTPAATGTTVAPVASQAAPAPSAPTTTESAAPIADASTETPANPANPTDHPALTTPSAKPSTSTAPTAVASTAPTPTAVESAAPAARSGSPASGVMAGCWKNNAPPGTAASSATASFTVDGNGKTSSIVIAGPARSVSNFPQCSVLGISALNFGPGPAGPVTASASFPAIKK